MKGMFIGVKTRNKIVDLIREHLDEHAVAILDQDA
jgi:hypothetical protein